MPIYQKSAIALLVVFASNAALAQDEACQRPWPVIVPQQLPEREELIEIQRRVRTYLDLAEAYLKCNDAAQRAIIVDDNDADSIRAGEIQTEVLVRRYNNTVDEMHVVGEHYNRLVRAYKDGDNEDAPPEDVTVDGETGSDSS